MIRQAFRSKWDGFRLVAKPAHESTARLFRSSNISKWTPSKMAVTSASRRWRGMIGQPQSKNNQTSFFLSVSLRSSRSSRRSKSWMSSGSSSRVISLVT